MRQFKRDPPLGQPSLASLLWLQIITSNFKLFFTRLFIWHDISLFFFDWAEGVNFGCSIWPFSKNLVRIRGHKRRNIFSPLKALILFAGKIMLSPQKDGLINERINHPVTVQCISGWHEIVYEDFYLLCNEYVIACPLWILLDILRLCTHAHTHIFSLFCTCVQVWVSLLILYNIVIILL